MNLLNIAEEKEGLNKILVLFTISILPYKNFNLDLKDEIIKRKVIFNKFRDIELDKIYSAIQKLYDIEDSDFYTSYQFSSKDLSSEDVVKDLFDGIKLVNDCHKLYEEEKIKQITLDLLNQFNEHIIHKVSDSFIDSLINPKENFEEKIIYRTNKDSFGEEDLEEILEHAYKLKASDIHIQTNQPIKVDIHSRFYKLTDRDLSVNEVETFIKKIYGDNAITEMNQKNPIDKSTFIRLPDSGKMIRFRVNAVGELSNGVDGIQITIRTIDSKPPKLSVLKVEDEIVNNLVPSQGIIIITGPTGSGKSTLLAANIANILENPDREKSKKIVTYEAPIEFVYDEVEKHSNIISQTEIGTHLKNWDAAVETAMRRKPNIILIGESRDPETIRNSILAAQTGHLLYTTAHTNGVAETVRRMINVFSPEERSSLQYDLIESLKMIVSQRLLKTIDGKRVAIREYLVFTEDVKDRILSVEANLMTRELKNIVKEKGQRLIDDAKRKLDEGLISEDEFNEAKKSFGGD